MLEKLGLIPLIPFIGFLLNGLFGHRRGKRFVTSVALLASFGAAFAASIAVLEYNEAYRQGGVWVNVVYTWFQAGGVGTDIAFQIDRLSSVMVLVVTWIGFLIHVYSVGYMAHEDGYARYFAYLNLFLSAMLILVLGSSYLFVFVGWEGVGLCSYLLIGYYYEKDSAAAAGKKAFIVNRIGDFGFLLAMFLMFEYAGSVDFGAVSTAASTGVIGGGAATAICLLLFLGACGKSAQIPLYVWLPDAMAGPTPVSALIHAATMVTAGVYMVVRSNVLFRAAPVAMMVVAIIGALTALVAASIALAQNDIKKVLAYSTVSQLGFMFLGAGVGGFVAAIFHLVTHAFFKACLFLGSGSVIHAMSGEQDIRNMGGLRKKIPITFWTFAIATVAIAGFPPLAGFFSKDEILATAWSSHQFPIVGKLVYFMGAIAAFFTAFYMFRLLYLTFYGTFRGTHEQEHHLHESPATMTFPLIVLAALSAVGGFLGIPSFGGMINAPNFIEHWLHPIFPEVEGLPDGIVHIAAAPAISVAVFSTLVALAGWLIARAFYRTRALEKDAELEAKHPSVIRALTNKYWVDETYDRGIVSPLNRFSLFLWKVIDAIIDGLIALGGYIVAAFGDLMRFLQTGYVRNYALMLFLSVVALIWLYV